MEKLKQFCYNKKYTIISAIAIFIIAIFLCFWITQKQGFHEDEIFSYGSSNYKWDSMFQLVGKSDYTNTAIEKYIIADSFSDTLKNIKSTRHYFTIFQLLSFSSVKSNCEICVAFVLWSRYFTDTDTLTCSPSLMKIGFTSSENR